MNRIRLILVTCALLFSTLACRVITKLISPEEDSVDYDTPSQPQPAHPTKVMETQSCPVLLSDIMDAALTPGSDEDPLEETYLVTYTVHGDQISNPQYESVSIDLKDEQQDSASQEQVWEYFATIIPADQRRFLTEYSITTDGKDNTLAAVTQTYNDPNEWALEVDVLDINDTYSLTFTLVHEFGHLLTLGPSQVPPSNAVFNNPDDEDVLQSEVNACSQYFPGEGCSKSDSYINAWYERFWAGIYSEWDEINYEQDEDKYYQLLDDFYYKYQDQFLTDYAVTTPEEDIAESFAFFVLAPKPSGNSIADQKVLFFYKYPELVALRESIIQNICTNLPSQ